MENPSPVHMPAEWEPQEAVWLSWPLGEATWPGLLGRIQERMAELAASISRFQKVRICCRSNAQLTARRQLAKAGADPVAVELLDIPTDDAWCRDHGPLFVRRVDGPAIVDFRYNAWGGKFPPWEQDDAVARRAAETLGLPRIECPIVCEGGALESNGAGLLLTTERVLLNKNRNPGRSREEIESHLRAALGVREIFWLHSGLHGDDTDGHIDTIARFFQPGGLLVCREDDPADPDYVALARNWKTLESYRNAEYGSLDLVALPMPGPVLEEKYHAPRLPATYANFLVINDAVIVPTYGQSETDSQACGIIGDCFPGREIVPFDSREFLMEGGAVHCLSQNEFRRV